MDNHLHELPHNRRSRIRNMVLQLKTNWRIREGPKRVRGDTHNMSYQPPRILCAGILPEYWLRDAHVTRRDPELDQIRAKQDDWSENPEINPIAIKPGSWWLSW